MAGEKRSATEKAHAKVNLSLRVLSKREDGYHEILSVMQTVGLADKVFTEVDFSSARGHTSVASGKSFVPGDMRNTAFKAAEVFRAHTGMRFDIKIAIKKLIPVGAGLGGGSADAAAVLRALNALTESGLSLEELRAMGKKVGADVPFCIGGGTAKAEGIGEIITPLKDMPDCAVLLCKPPFSVKTPEAFRLLDEAGAAPGKDRGAALFEAIEKADKGLLAASLCNDFEAVIAERHPEIWKIKEKLLSRGADAAQMSGSGPTVFALFFDRERGAAAFKDMKKKYRQVYLTGPAGAALPL